MHAVKKYGIYLVLAFIWQAGICNAQGLRPSLINIAQGKTIVTTSTCGEGFSVTRNEVFCRLATVPGPSGTPISGLSCDKCDSQDVNYSHPIEYAIDGSEKWWQSPPLSRGMKYQSVNITIDLRQEYQVAYVIIKTGNAPRPGVWALEKSADGGKTFKPWQYFATSASECLQYFGVTPLLRQVQDDTVICSIEYSQVPPFENGEIHISLVNGRPGASNFSYSKGLQEWTLATHVRLRLVKVKTLLADLLPLAREDPTVTRRYFYSIKDISIGGICMCNGHADACVYSEDNSQFVCQCKHNTCGTKCDKCCPGFVQKKWKPGNGNGFYECEACNCHGHAVECNYNERVDEAKRSLDLNGNYEGGGVCINCQQNTIGINCERCKPGYYRPTGVPKTSKEACQECNCDRSFSTGHCYDGEGNCKCLPSFSGPHCNTCSEGFYDFPNCKPCDCHPMGTAGGVCGPTGKQCPCKPNYTGAKCDQCTHGHHSFPQCKPCSCDRAGSFGQSCDAVLGQCSCSHKYAGLQCNQCSRGFFNFPQCQPCNCDTEGTARDICDPNSGQCICIPNFGGPRCDVCNEGFYRFPFCLGCNCSRDGSSSPSCNQYGGCECRENFEGRKCDYCRLGYYDYPKCIRCTCDVRGAYHEFCDQRSGQCTCKGSFKGLQCNLCQTRYYGFPKCKQCQCNPFGIKPIPGRPLGDCSFSNTGQCDCKDNVQGLECTECKEGAYNLQGNNPLGCEACNCNSDGVIGGLVICNDRGQCPCKLYVVGRACGRCKMGYFGLKGFKMFGCSGCDCDVGGSYDQYCEDVIGQCRCRPNVQGRRCNRPSPRYFSPSLLHIKAEIEDGASINGKVSSSDRDIPGRLQGSVLNGNQGNKFPVRFGFDEAIFPGFSWRGYAVISELQKSIEVSLDIPKTSAYFLLFRYVLDQEEPATGVITLTPKEGRGIKQSSALQFIPTKVPGILTVGGAAQPVQFMLTEGTWQVRLDLQPTKLLLDFVSALPRDYSEANILNKKVTKPCQVGGSGEHCNQFTFPSLSKPDFVSVEMETGHMYTRAHKRQDTQLFDDPEVLKQLDFNAMALLNISQTRVTEMISFRKPGQYVFVIQYYRPFRRTEPLRVFLRSSSGYQQGTFYLNDCQFRFGCRQVALDRSGKVKVFDVERLTRMAVTLLSNTRTPVAIDSITAIPLEQWSLDYIVPSILCTTEDNKCIPSSYPTPKDAVKMDVDDDVGDGDGDDADSSPLPLNILDPTVKLKYLQGGTTYEIAGSVPKAGRYGIVLHYFQPSHVTFQSRVTVASDRASTGSVRFTYCPHTSGCRAVLHNSTGGVLFNIDRPSVALQITISPNTSSWLDYALFVAEELFSQNLAEAEPISLTSAYLQQCGQTNLLVNGSVPAFCKASAFSVTTDFLQTTLPCDCHVLGSLSDSCAEFGGQCPCKDHVIGRKCNKCKTGYYGFPDCKKCSCVYCNEVTGACDCPPKTVGARCELCLIGTYGHDPIIGCRDCECDRNGVADSAISCNSQTGQCQCRPSHRGRSCDECTLGHYFYPFCHKCSCDPRGVSENVCDRKGNCLCKTGVTGDRCDKCAPGYFNFDANNPDGCTKCWCSGLSDTCTNGDFYRSGEVFVMAGWLLDNTPAQVTKSGPSTLTAVINGERTEKGKPIYWVAPADYLGNKLYSYGGNLTYSIRYDNPKGEVSAVLTKKPDVIIKGTGGIALQYKEQLQAAPGATFVVQIQFTERLWETTNGSSITRDDFMSVLLNLESLRLRASYSTLIADVSINEIKMDSAVQGPVPGAQAIASVEKCDCPDKAKGASCEFCGAGYTRADDNTTCVPCKCSGHSNDCHPESGLCYNCSHNAAGNLCEMCQPGYYDTDPNVKSSECSMCACPLGISSNTFATECALGAGGTLGCVCKAGYSGSRCEKCADGFYGNPSEPGDYCKRCACSGNINPSVKGSCDQLTGKCLKCINGATGDQCDRCVDGYYGDAITHKNCTKCRCSACGAETAMCDGTSGVCTCKINVVGETCQKCKPNAWGFDSCLGCKDCACAEASLGPSCEVTSGQCSCTVGVTGRRCDRCRAGFWDYTGAGCTACNCPSGAENLHGFCDVNTGQCCKPGGNCTICPRSYRLTPGGCEFCGDCVDRLLVTATELNDNVTKVLQSVQGGVSGSLTQTALNKINETLQRLTPLTNEYNVTMAAVQELVGSSYEESLDSVNDYCSGSRNVSHHQQPSSWRLLSPGRSQPTYCSHSWVQTICHCHYRGNLSSSASLTERTDISETSTADLYSTVMLYGERGMNVSRMAGAARYDAQMLEQEIIRVTEVTGNLITFVQRVAENLLQGEANQSSLIQEAEEILKELRERDFLPVVVSVSDERQLVELALNEGRSKLNDTLELWNKAHKANRTLRELEGRFRRILEKSMTVMERALEAVMINAASKRYDSETPTRGALALRADLDVILQHVKEMLETTEDFLNRSSVSFQKFKGNSEVLDELIRKVNERLSNLSKASIDLEPLVTMAADSSLQLRSQSDELDKLLTDTEQFTDKVVNASNRYSDITKALNDSLEIAKEANQIASDTKTKSMNLSNEAELSRNESDVLEEDATTLEGSVRTLEKNFTDVQRRVQSIKDEILQTTNDLEHVDSTLSEMDDYTLIEDRAASSDKTAEDSFATAEDAREVAEEIERNLPGLSNLKEDFIQANKSITELDNDLDEIVTNFTDIRKRTEVLREIHEASQALDTEVKERIEDIQNMMSESYTLLDSMSLVMKFGAASAVSRSPPPTVQDNSRFTDLLFYTKPLSDTGLLTYLGAVKDKKNRKRLKKHFSPVRSDRLWSKKQTTKRHRRQNMCQKDFAAVFLREKKVHFAMCMDGVFTEVNSSAAVKNDTWIRIQAQILPSLAKLDVSYFNEDKKVVLTTDQEAFSVANPVLKIGQSGKLLIGGIPTGKRLPTALLTGKFLGCIDGLEMNGYNAGPWNAEVLQNASHCTPRKEFTVAVTRSYHLYGSGYLQVDTSSDNNDMLEWEFEFNTPFSNGLLMIGIDGKENPTKEKTMFFAVEMINGKIVFSYNVGLDTQSISSEKFYDDVMDYRLTMKTKGLLFPKFTLTITNLTSKEQEELAKDKLLNNNDNYINVKYVYFGGMNNRTRLRHVNITSRFFKGCISNIVIKTRGQKASTYSTGYKKGCVKQVARAATFLGADSFLQLRPRFDGAMPATRFGFAFRATTATGLLLYVTHNTEDYVALGLKDGKVVLMAYTGKHSVTLSTRGSKHSDDKWHFVTVRANVQHNWLELLVDDESSAGKLNSSRTRIQRTSELYIGGVPEDKKRDDKLVQIAHLLTASFGGSIKDFTVDGSLQNLAETFKRNSVNFGDDEARQRTDVRDYIIKKPTSAPPVVTSAPTTQSESTKDPVPTTFDLTTDSAPMTSDPATDSESVTSEPTTMSALMTSDSTTESAPVTSDPTTDSVPMTSDPTTDSESVTSKPTTMSALMTSDPTTESAPVTSDPTTDSAPMTSHPTTDSALMTSDPTSDSAPVTSDPTSDSAPVTSDPTTDSAPVTSELTTKSALMTSEPFNVTSAPITQPQCVRADYLPQNSVVKTFGADVYSYLQYNISGSRVLGKLIGGKTKIQLEFKTYGASGIILHVADPSEKQLDFVACYLEKGQVVCGFGCGGGVVTLKSLKTYNDGLWHTLRFHRKAKNGTLYVDEVKVNAGVATGSPESIDKLKTLYIGGVPKGFNTRRTPKNMWSFPGCVTNFTVNKMSPGDAQVQKKTVGCYSEGIDSGVTFQDGYIIVQNEYGVGTKEDITLEIRPTSNTALLLSVASNKGDYLALEMINGSLYFRFDNGDGGVVVKREFSAVELCDGRWHKIKAWKENHEAWLQVDDGEIGHAAAAKIASTSTDVFNRLYVGGLPDDLEQKGVTVKDKFVGCMRKLVADKDIKHLSAPVVVAGDIYRGGCVFNTLP